MSNATSSPGRRSRRSVDSHTGRGFTLANGLATLLLALFACAPLLYPGYLQVHSGFLPLFNLADLAAAGDRLRWLPTVGAAPDWLRGEGPLAYWLALPLSRLLGEPAAVKLVFAAGMLLGAAAMLLEARKETDGNPRGLLRAALFLFWPPLLAAVYVRGAFAETLFMGLFALAFAMTNYELRLTTDGQPSRLSRLPGSRIEAKRVAKSGLWTVYCLLFTVYFLFWTHPGLALWATALLLTWTLGQRRGRAAFAVAVGALAGGGSYWLLHRGLPIQTLDVAAHAVAPYQLLNPVWGFGVSTSGWQDTLPLQLGFAALALAALSLTLRRPRSDASSSLLLTTYCLLFTLLLTTTAARPLWQLPPFAATLTYPWQLNALIGPLLIVVAGEVFSAAPTLAARPARAALVALVVLASTPYLAPRFTPTVPNPAQPQIFESAKVTLLDAELQGPAEIGTGQTITVTLAWQPLQPVDFDYNVFIHAVDAADSRVAQWDGQPLRGDAPAPMTQWAVGEVVTGVYRLDLPADAAPQQLWIGLYNWQTGQRQVMGSDDKAIVEVRP